MTNLNVFVSTQFKWLNFLGQNDSIFSLSAPRENWVILTLKVESLAELKFDLKSRVIGGTKIRPKFLGQNDIIFFAQCTERKNWVILTVKVESLGELKFDPTF